MTSPRVLHRRSRSDRGGQLSDLAARCWCWQIRRRAVRGGDSPGAREDGVVDGVERVGGGVGGGMVVGVGVGFLSVFQVGMGGTGVGGYVCFH